VQLSRVGPVVSPRFAIQRFAVEGNTVLQQSEIDRIVAPFKKTGPDRDFGDIQQALKRASGRLPRPWLQRRARAGPRAGHPCWTGHPEVTEAKLRQVRVEVTRLETANVRASFRRWFLARRRTLAASGRKPRWPTRPVKQSNVVLESTDSDNLMMRSCASPTDDPKHYTVFPGQFR